MRDRSARHFNWTSAIIINTSLGTVTARGSTALRISVAAYQAATGEQGVAASPQDAHLVVSWAQGCLGFACGFIIEGEPNESILRIDTKGALGDQSTES
jgi:hypothetical protein